jgi:hypothetical protein
LLEKSVERKDVIGLALAIRSARLLTLSKNKMIVNQFTKSLAERQQLAIETLKLWAPLSYQV